MERLTILAFCLISTLAIGTPPVDAQTNAPLGQNGSPGTVNGRSPASNVHPNAPISRNITRGPVTPGPRAINLPPAQSVGQRAINLRSNYSPLMRRLNPTLAEMSARPTAQIDNAQSIPGIPARREIAQTALPSANAQPIVKTDNLQPTSDDLARRQMSERSEGIDAQRIARPDDLQPTRKIPAREEITPSGPATPGVQTGRKIHQPPSDELLPRETRSKPQHKWHGNNHHRNFSDAFHCHRHEWHDRNWWKQNCNTIVFVNSGYYFLDAGYWYPAWGYDPVNSYYDYDGPVYTYGNLLPDQVIANVQEALQDAGYYFGAVTGSLNVETRAALANFQRDYGLPITGAIDQPTIETLGLY